MVKFILEFHHSSFRVVKLVIGLHCGCSNSDEEDFQSDEASDKVLL